MDMGIELLRSKSLCYNNLSDIRSRNWLRNPKRKSLAVNIRKLMSKSFGLIPSENTCRQDRKIDKENRELFTSEGA